MNKSGKEFLKKSGFGALLASTSIATMVLLTSAANAQETPKAEEKETVNFDEIVVIGVKRQIQESNALERMADNIVSVITANDIGQFPDQNIAETLQRLPGITIIRDEGEGRFISVRGLDKSYVQVTVNNAQMGSSEGEGSSLPPSGDRSVALDVIPADLLSKVEVGKTLFPDQDHDSLGAKVDLRPLSAFDRSKDFTGKVILQGTYTDFANETRPKIVADFTYRTKVGDQEFGIAGAINYFERAITGDNAQSRSSGGIQNRDGILVPREIDQRIELGQRDRLGATFTMDYRVTDDHKWNFSFLYGRLEDEDIRVQQEVELRDASASEVISLSQGQGRFSDVDIERQIQYELGIEETYAIHFEGSNRFADEWTVSYAVDYSRNSYDVTDSFRGQFRERDAIVDAVWGEDFAEWSYVGRGDNDNPDDIDLDFRPGLEDFEFSEARMTEENRQDEVFAYNIDLKREFLFNDREAGFKFGIKRIKRDRIFLRGEFEIDPEDFFDDPAAEFMPRSLADIETFTPPTRLNNLGGGLAEGAAFPDLAAFQTLLADTRNFVGFDPTDTRRDFTLNEDIDAAYFMGDYQLTDNLKVIAGVRVERTRLQTTGNVGRRATFTPLGDEDSMNVTIPGVGDNTFRKEYTTWLPGVHFRYDPSDDIVARFSYSKAQVRPGFGSVSALQEVRFEFFEPDGECVSTTVSLDGVPTSVCVEEAELEGGNPLLDPLTADQFDFNIGWYPLDDSSVTFAVFYKDMKNVFIGTTSGGATDILTSIPYTNIDGIINGEGGKLYGVEFSAQHFFTHLDGFLGNTFITGNLSLINSEISDPNLRDGEKFRLPGQSNISANLSVGYEDENILLRLSLNHKGNELSVINLSSSRLGDADLSVRDEYDDATTRLGFTARYYINDNFQLFGNVKNITNSKKREYFLGDETSGRMFNRTGDFGRTITFGIVGSF